MKAMFEAVEEKQYFENSQQKIINLQYLHRL